MAYLISDKRHGNEVYVTEEALNMAFFPPPPGMTDLSSSFPPALAVFSAFWHVLPRYCWPSVLPSATSERFAAGPSTRGSGGKRRAAEAW